MQRGLIEVGFFERFKAKKPAADWNDAYVAAPKFYRDASGSPFGAIALTEGTETVLPRNPQAEYRVVVSVMKDGTSGEWKAVVESVTQLKTDYGAAGSNWDSTRPMLFTNKYISASSLPLTGRMGAERRWQIAAGGVGVLALLAVAAADQWRRKKRLS